MSAACTPLAHPTPLDPFPRVGRGVGVGLEDSGLAQDLGRRAGVGELVEVGFLWQMMKFGLVSGDSHMIT